MTPLRLFETWRSSLRRRGRTVAGGLLARRRRFSDHPLRGAATLALAAAWALLLAWLALSPGLLVAALVAALVTAALLLILIAIGPQRTKPGQRPEDGQESQTAPFGLTASPPRYETPVLGREEAHPWRFVPPKRSTTPSKWDW